MKILSRQVKSTRDALEYVAFWWLVIVLGVVAFWIGIGITVFLMVKGVIL